MARCIPLIRRYSEDRSTQISCEVEVRMVCTASSEQPGLYVSKNINKKIENILLKAICTPTLTTILLTSKQMYTYKNASTYNITYSLRLTFVTRWIYLLCQLTQNRHRKTDCKVSTCVTKVKHIQVENMAVRNWRQVDMWGVHQRANCCFAE